MPGFAVQPPQSAPPAAPQALEIDLGAMFRSLWRRRWTIITFGVLGIAIGLIIALATTPTFTSETRLMLESQRNEVLDTSIIAGLNLSDEIVETEIEVVASREIKSKTSEAINLQAIIEQRLQEEEKQLAHPPPARPDFQLAGEAQIGPFGLVAAGLG